MPTCEKVSPWLAVAITRDAYQRKTAIENVTNEQWLADKCTATEAAHKAARDDKAVAYRAYVHAVHAAVKSGEPWDE